MDIYYSFKLILILFTTYDSYHCFWNPIALSFLLQYLAYF